MRINSTAAFTAVSEIIKLSWLFQSEGKKNKEGKIFIKKISWEESQEKWCGIKLAAPTHKCQVLATIVRSRMATSFTHLLPTRQSLSLHQALNEALGTERKRGRVPCPQGVCGLGREIDTWPGSYVPLRSEML